MPTAIPDSCSRLAALALTALVLGCSSANRSQAQAQDDQCSTRLATFDTLDYDVFTNQKWDRLSESHAPDIVVSWPDGHDTNGIEKHVEDLKAMFVYAPNTSIKEHPIRICSGDYTAVMGVMTGTFSQPMPTPDGKTIAPTGKSFRLPMTTIGLWKGTTMTHEWLFWDNQTYMRQIGLAP
jgi:SnoaL-like polyketide cyclase